MQKKFPGKSKSFIIVPLGEVNQAEIDNAILLANMAQKSFNFVSHGDVTLLLQYHHPFVGHRTLSQTVDYHLHPIDDRSGGLYTSEVIRSLPSR